jgi:PHP family Zn ribbon phosphoesterase
MRERDAGGPEDRACYQCTCGYVFEAAVLTSVDCPHCGGTQAW